MNKKETLDKLNHVVGLILGKEYVITEQTCAAICQEIVNDRYRKIIKDNVSFNEAVAFLSEINKPGKKK